MLGNAVVAMGFHNAESLCPLSARPGFAGQPFNLDANWSAVICGCLNIASGKTMLNKQSAVVEPSEMYRSLTFRPEGPAA